MALTPGLVLSDRYRLTSRLAVGGMGEVWVGEDTRLARRVAVKILRAELTGDPEFVERFRSEARITASLNHPGIAAVYDYGEVASIAGGPHDTAYLVMELIAGEPLSVVLARSSRLSVPRTLDVLGQAGRALQAAHVRALVHRDIKPGNVLVTPGGQVKITDFGIAKVAHDAPLTRGGMVMGTAQYLSPEQAVGGHATPASDVYSLGVLAFECLSGRRPFIADNPLGVALAHVHQTPPALPPDVPPPVADLVLRMLAKDPARRFPDGRALALAVARLRQGGSVAPPAMTPLDRVGAATRAGSAALSGPPRVALPATRQLPARAGAAPLRPPGPSGPRPAAAHAGPLRATPSLVPSGQRRPPAPAPGSGPLRGVVSVPYPETNPPARTPRRSGVSIARTMAVLVLVIAALAVAYVMLSSAGWPGL